jgi:hypothetical protein
MQRYLRYCTGSRGFHRVPQREPDTAAAQVRAMHAKVRPVGPVRWRFPHPDPLWSKPRGPSSKMGGEWARRRVAML